MKRATALGISAAVVLGAVAGFIYLRSEKSSGAQIVTFAFTGDVRGRLVPCGCFTGQLGGLTRIATLFGPGPSPNFIKVDIGDAIEGSEDYDRIQYRYILRAFQEMHYEAVNLGHREAALTAVQLRELKQTAAVPMLSANLLDAATGAPLFDSHRIVRRGGWRIALVGVMDPSIPAETLGEGLKVERIETSLSRLLPSLKTQADFIVLLAFTNEAAMRSLAREFYELNVILGGKVTQPSQELTRENRSLILYVTNESRAAGVLEVKLETAGKMTPLKGEVMLVSDRIREDTAIQSLAHAYRDEVRRTKLDIDNPERLEAGMVPGVKNIAKYAGTESCTACHSASAHVWADTGHAHAFATLVQAKADADPKCIGCHTVGFQTPSGYRRELGASRLVNVGCESCHGPGSLHVEQRLAGADTPSRFRPLGAGDCQKCHHGEFSRPFDWDKFWPPVRHTK